MVKRLVKTFNKIHFLILLYWLKSNNAVIGKDLKIYGKFWVRGDFKNIVIGNNCTINLGVLLGARGGIKIGNNVRLSPFVKILSSGLNSGFNEDRLHFNKNVVLNDNVWLATGVIVNGGVEIGENSIIGAGSVVTRSIPANVFAAGVPAKVIKQIDGNPISTE